MSAKIEHGRQKKVALITGVTGQDGAYLAEFLLDKGYEVHGIKRRTSLFNTYRIDHLYQDRHESGVSFFLHHGDMTDSTSLLSIIKRTKPDEVYNLAAQSHVAVSFEEPEYTANSDALGTLRLLEAIKILGLEDHTKFYQASTSELYGEVVHSPQNEMTPFNPRSPYAVAKLYAFSITNVYREAYGIFACNGILFNHESPMRGETFVTRKITRALTRIKLGLQNVLFVGNLDAKRDWGHAKDYVEAMWLMLQHEAAEDFVIATGQQCSVRQFIELVCSKLSIDIEWRGEGLKEVGYAKLFETSEKTEIIKIDTRYFRPLEVEDLLGDASKARRLLSWKPRYSLDDMVTEMVDYDLELANAERQADLSTK